MPPDDPLGRNGPSLNNFLKSCSSVSAGLTPHNLQPCPYEKKCTYGNKCKFYHAERGTAPIKTVTDKLKVEIFQSDYCCLDKCNCLKTMIN